MTEMFNKMKETCKLIKESPINMRNSIENLPIVSYISDIKCKCYLFL